MNWARKIAVNEFKKILKMTSQGWWEGSAMKIFKQRKLQWLNFCAIFWGGEKQYIVCLMLIMFGRDSFCSSHLARTHFAGSNLEGKLKFI